MYSKNKLHTETDGSDVGDTLQENPEEETAFMECDSNITPIDKHDEKQDIALSHLIIFERMRKDLHYRKRFIHSLCLFMANVSLGLNFGIIGPTFPDLRRIVEADISTASWLFTTFFIGHLVGSFVAGILYDRFNKLLLIFFSVLGLALGCGALPWCGELYVMIAVRFVGGIAAGGLNTGVNADMLSIWKEQGRSYMQALHFSFGIGGFIAPLVAEPYLANADCVEETMANGTSNISFLHPFVTVTSDNMSFDNNFSFVDSSNENKTIANECVDINGETSVHIPYLIIAVYNMCSALPFLVMYVKTQRQKQPYVVKCDQSRKGRPSKLSIKLKLVLLILLSALLLLYNAVEDTFAGYLMTFVIEQLHWDKHAGSFVSSMFWVAFSCGRLLGICIVRCFKPVQLLFVFLMLLNCSLIGILIGSIKFVSVIVNVFVPLAGVFMSIIFPSVFSWAEESILEVTGKISALFLIASSCGSLLNPLLLGHLMKIYGAIWFVYLFLAQSIVVFGVFLTLVFLVKYVVNKQA